MYPCGSGLLAAIGLAGDDGVNKLIDPPAGGGFTMGGLTGQGDLVRFANCGAGACSAAVFRGRFLVFA